MLRNLIERLVRGRSLRRSMPPEFGRRAIYLSPDAALSYMRWDWSKGSKGLLSAAKKYVRSSDNVWDIGGNVGVFAIGAAHIAGAEAEIVTVEADPFLALLLQKSVSLKSNSDRNINILCAAVSSEHGIAKFMVAQRGRSSNSLEESGFRGQAGGIRYMQHVPTISLDSMLDHFAKPSVIKIDVEGAEALVLQGASRILSETRPIFYIEVDADMAEEVTKKFKANNYRLYNADIEDEIELDRCSFNTLAVPSESKLTNNPSISS